MPTPFFEIAIDLIDKAKDAGIEFPKKFKPQTFTELTDYIDQHIPQEVYIRAETVLPKPGGLSSYKTTDLLNIMIESNSKKE